MESLQYNEQVEMCIQPRFISPWAFNQFDQRLIYLTEEMLDPWLPIQCSLKTDQTEQIAMLILVFDGQTYKLVPFAENWLICKKNKRFLINQLFDSPARQRWWYTLVNFHWARVRFGPMDRLLTPQKQCLLLFRRPSYFQSSTIALDTGLLLKAKMPIRDLTTEL